MKSFTSYFLLFAFYLLLLGCGERETPPPTIQPTIIDATGKAIPILTPSKIVSLAPSITSSVYLLEAQDKLVGVTCRLPEGEKMELVGDLLNPNIEKIIQLQPDLVLATKEGNRPEIIEQLRKLGVRVFVSGEAKSWADIQRGFRQLGRLLGKEPKAEEVLDNIVIRLNKVKERIVSLSKKRVFVELSPNPLMSAAQNTFIDEAITRAGGINIAHKALTRYPIYGIEEIINQDPEVIIITAMGKITQQAQEMWQRFPTLSAVKNNKIFVLEAEIVCEPTPENFVRAVEMIAKMINRRDAENK